MSAIGVGDRVVVEHVLPRDLTIKTDSPPVTFNIHDCYRMAFAVGCGLTAGVLAVLATALLIAALIRVVMRAVGVA